MIVRSEKPETALSPFFEKGILRRPDGTGSVHLFRAISLLCGYPSFSDDGAVTELRDAIGEFSHYVFILIDGMGASLSSFFPANGFFAKAERRNISSVYPSTTAVAMTSQATGLWPAEHGVTGWYTYMPERGITVIPLKASERFSGRPLEHFDISFREVVTPDSIIPDYTCMKRVFIKKALRKGQFARWAYFGITRTGTRTLTQSFDRLRHHVRGAAGPFFTHLYTEDLDSTSHRNGPAGESVQSLIHTIDAKLSELRDDAGDHVRIIVTSDHGHSDVDPERHHLLHEGDPLLETLAAPPSGDSRNPIFHVGSGGEADFSELFSERYGEDFVLVRPCDIEAEKLMGPVLLSDLTRSRLGTYVGIAKTASAIEYIPADSEGKHHKGMHGGLSTQEIEVPMFLM